VFVEHAIVAAAESNAVVVDDATDVDLLMQMPVLLAAVRLKGKCFTRHLYAFLILYVFPDNFECDRTDRGNESAPGPQARKTALEPGIFRAKHMGGISLDLPDNRDNADLRAYIQQQVNMVRHDFHAKHGVPVVTLLLLNQLLEPGRQGLIQHATAVLRAPDDMVLAAIDQRMRGVVRLASLFDSHLLSPLDRYDSFYQIVSQ